MTKRLIKSKPKQTSKSLLYPFIEFNRITIISIIAGLMLLIFLTLFLPKIMQKHELASEAAASRARFEPSADKKHQDKIDLLIKTGLFEESSPILRQKFDTCVIVPSSSGTWVTDNWTQYCKFEYIDYVPTDYSKDELSSLLADQYGIEQTFGTPTYNKDKESCVIYNGPELFSLEYFSSTGSSEKCKSFKNWKDGKPGDIVPAPLGKSYIHKNFKPNDIDTSKAYVKVHSLDDYYSSKELGCHLLSFVICKAPFDAAPGFK